MSTVALVLGVLAVVAWLFMLATTRRMVYLCVLHGRPWSHTTIFQFAVLPFIIGWGLIITRNLLWIPAGAAAFVIGWVWPWFLLVIFPTAAGWVCGQGALGLQLPWWAAGFIGFIAVFFACSILFAIATSPAWSVAETPENKPPTQERSELEKEPPNPPSRHPGEQP